MALQLIGAGFKGRPLREEEKKFRQHFFWFAKFPTAIELEGGGVKVTIFFGFPY